MRIGMRGTEEAREGERGGGVSIFNRVCMAEGCRGVREAFI